MARLLLALDTSVAAYFLREARRDDKKDRFVASNALFEESRYEFVIPSVVVGELLVPIMPDLRRKLIKEIYTNFAVLSFDGRAAELAAAIYRTREQVNCKQLETKAMCKYDAQIVATAVRWEAWGLCTFDDNQKKQYASLCTILGDTARANVGEPADFVREAELLVHHLKSAPKEEPVNESAADQKKLTLVE